MAPTKIKRLRNDLGESQETFGKRFGVDQSTIQRWETKGLPTRGATRIAVSRMLLELREEVPARAA